MVLNNEPSLRIWNSLECRLNCIQTSGEINLNKEVNLSAILTQTLLAYLGAMEPMIVLAGGYLNPSPTKC